MSVRDIIQKFGAPAMAFAARSILGAILPGAPVIADVAGEVVGLASPAAKTPAVSVADFQKVQHALERMSDQMNGLTETVARFSGNIATDYPNRTPELIVAKLRTQVSQTVLDGFQTFAEQLEFLEKQNRQLLQAHQIAEERQTQMLCLLERMASIARFVGELRASQATVEEFSTRLRAFQVGEKALAEWNLTQAQDAFSSLQQQLPESVAAAIGLGTAQLAVGETNKGLETLAHAADMGNGDLTLTELVQSWPPTVIKRNRRGFSLVQFEQDCRWGIIAPDQKWRHKGTSPYISNLWKTDFADP